MDKFITLQDIDYTTEFIKKTVPVLPKFGLVLGSGLGGLADEVKNPYHF